jgi:two-component system response regulator FixJ
MFNNNEATSGLTIQELEVLKLLGEGLSGKEIGATLGISPKTVEFHRLNVAKNSGAGNAVLMVRWAIRQRIVEA